MTAVPRQIRLSLATHGLVFNYFGGFGGVTLGWLMALGYLPHVHVNHWALAVQVHHLNFPGPIHLQTDVRDIDPDRDLPGGDMCASWFSPDCTQFSTAKCGKRLDRKLRGLAWMCLRVAAKRRPPVIFLENVRGFLKWGPLNCNGRPIKKHVGRTFKRFVAQLEDLGYVIEHRILDAADYGTPSHRKRLILIARCDGKPIVWPKKTHGPKAPLPWRSAAECIDWAHPVRSIFDRRKDLKPKTQRRIAVGIQRFVLDRPPLIENGMAWCGMVRGYGEHSKQAIRTLDLTQPMHTIVAGGAKDGLVAVWLIKHYSGVYGVPFSKPMGTITATDHHAIGAVYLTRERQERTEAWLREQLGDDVDLTVRHNGETYRIADVGMRMLNTHELLLGMGFPADYLLLGSATDQQTGIGNAVPPQLAAAIIAANLGDEQAAPRARKRAA